MSYLEVYGHHHPQLPAEPLCAWAGPCDPSAQPTTKCLKRRVSANKKERKRTLSINRAFSELRNRIPEVPADTKLSKIKTLRMATNYISHLMDVLANADNNSPHHQPFSPEPPEQQQPGASNYLEAIHPSKKRKVSGRTGWPQHVWALTLKRENPS